MFPRILQSSAWISGGRRAAAVRRAAAWAAADADLDNRALIRTNPAANRRRTGGPSTKWKYFPLCPTPAGSSETTRHANRRRARRRRLRDGIPSRTQTRGPCRYSMSAPVAPKPPPTGAPGCASYGRLAARTFSACFGRWLFGPLRGPDVEQHLHGGLHFVDAAASRTQVRGIDYVVDSRRRPRPVG